MGKNYGADKILVIGGMPGITERVKSVVEDSSEIDYAANQQEGLEKARQEKPDIIILGCLESQDATLDLHRKLKQGWITRNIPLLVVDMDSKAEPISKLREGLNTKLAERANTFREAVLDRGTFCVTWEQVPGRGAFEMQQDELFENVRKAVSGKKIHGVSITDNPSGIPAISSEMLGVEIKKLGIEPLVHLAFRDKNRSQCEGLLYGLAASGVKNLLLLTGDYPSSIGFAGKAKPVFDLDSVHGLQLVETMNGGMEYEVMQRKVALAPTDFFAGAAVSPFKQAETEVMGQYYKLKKKIEAGAKFIINQIGYDARKLHELLLWLKVKGYDIPVLANIYILPYGVAKTMNANQIAGCVVTDKLVADIAEERKAEDKGKSARLNRAAKMYALAKGMGYAGAHIGGYNVKYEMVEYVIEKGEELADDWEALISDFDYPQKDGFYFFIRDPKTRLNLSVPAVKPARTARPPIYELSRLAHTTIFEPKSIVFRALRPVTRWVDSLSVLKAGFGKFEHLNKVVLFDCMNCGDCALFDVAFLCPMSQCPKNQRNGPCGGSYEGWCEVYPNEKKCIWVKAYERLKGHKQEDTIGEYIVPPCNWELWQTPSWLNFYLGRDHTAERLGIKPPD